MAEMKVVNNNGEIKIVNINADKFKVGDKVHWFDSWDNLQWGTIAYEQGNAFAINEEGKKGISTGAKKEICWPTKEDCLKAEALRAEEQKKVYEESIGSVEDLVKFLFEHDIHGEFPDYEAKAVAEKKAGEFGIEVGA